MVTDPPQVLIAGMHFALVAACVKHIPERTVPAKRFSAVHKHSFLAEVIVEDQLGSWFQLFHLTSFFPCTDGA